MNNINWPNGIDWLDWLDCIDWPDWRKSALVFFCAVSVSCQVCAELTEYQVIEQGLINPDINAQWQAKLEQAHGEALNAGRWANPGIEYSQEDLDFPGGNSKETTIWLRQTVNIAGVNGLERKAAATAYLAEKKRQAMAIRQWQKTLRESFYQTLAAQEQSVLLNTAESQLQTINNMIKARAKRGDASRFDLLRINNVLSVTRSKHLSVNAKLAGSRSALLARIGSQPQQQPQTLKGNLLPKHVVEKHLIDKTVTWSEHPQLQALELQRQSALLSGRAAEREKWPEITLSLGRKTLDEPGISADGNAVSLGITLPLFDNGQGRQHIAENSARQLQAEIILQQRQLEVAYQSALLAYRANNSAALQLEALNMNAHDSLSKLAEARYQAGELGVMALLDAYQSDLEANEQYINAAMQARLAYIELQFLRGE